MSGCNLIRLSIVGFTLAISLGVAADPFDDARLAASESRYEDVINILSGVLESGGVEQESQVIALANRGVAYSLVRSYDRAKDDLLRAIALDPGHLLSQNHLGILAEHVKDDYAEAARWYGLAAQDGYAPAQTNLASLYERGVGVEQNSARAYELYLQASDQGYTMAFTPLGAMMLDGVGTVRQPQTGLQWLRKAAEAGLVSAHF